MTLRGLNWGHRRATAPMQAAAEAARARFGITLDWEVQPLSGFESGLNAALADRYDLIVFDHPFCGTIAAQGLMQKLDAVLGDLGDEDFIGGSLASYRSAGALWALPVDGATQAALLRPDLLEPHALPRDWAALLALGERLQRQGRWLGLASATPHGLLVLAALCANLGAPFATDPALPPFDPATLGEAAGLLRAAVRLSRPDGARMNAIGLHEAMAADDDIAYCPCAYVYLTYAEPDMPRPLRFAPFPGPDGSPRGTVLGGTGLGVTRSCRDLPAAHQVLRLLASWPDQQALVMRHHGQPARAEAWQGAEEDRAFAGAHAALRDTIEAAWTRPRFDGYITWQHEAGRVVEAFLADAIDVAGLAAGLRALWPGGAGS